MARQRKTLLEIEAAEEKRLNRKLSEKEGTIGYEIKNHIEEINKLKTKEEIIKYCENLLANIEGNVKGKMNFMHYLQKKRTAEDMLVYIWDYWFAGDNLRAYKTTYVKDGKNGIFN